MCSRHKVSRLSATTRSIVTLSYFSSSSSVHSFLWTLEKTVSRSLNGDCTVFLWEVLTLDCDLRRTAERPHITQRKKNINDKTTRWIFHVQSRQFQLMIKTNVQRMSTDGGKPPETPTTLTRFTKNTELFSRGSLQLISSHNKKAAVLFDGWNLWRYEEGGSTLCRRW